MRASAGIAGNGNPLSFDWSISAVRSLPISVSVELDPLSPGAMLLSVITPSIEHGRRAIDDDRDDDAHEQQRHAAGQQEQNLQRRLLVDAERQLEAALADVDDLHLDLGQRIHHRARRRQRHDRADEQAQLDAIEHSALRARPAAW